MESKEYTYNELMEMQEQAIRRVRDMQERARMTLEEHEAVREERNTESDKREESRSIRNEERKRETRPALPPKKPNADKGLFGDILKMDKDKALLLPILMLLGKDTADSILLIALMYIMS